MLHNYTRKLQIKWQTMATTEGKKSLNVYYSYNNNNNNLLIFVCAITSIPHVLQYILTDIRLLNSFTIQEYVLFIHLNIKFIHHNKLYTSDKNVKFLLILCLLFEVFNIILLRLQSFSIRWNWWIKKRKIFVIQLLWLTVRSTDV